MLRYLAILGLFFVSVVTAADAPLLVQADARITNQDGLSTAQCKFSSKPGRTLNFMAGDAGNTKFEFTITTVEHPEHTAYVIDVRITRGDLVLSRPKVQTLAGHEAKVELGDPNQKLEFSVLIEPGK